MGSTAGFYKRTASPTALDLPTTSESSSASVSVVSSSPDPGPLSPEVVASLRLNLSWLDLREAGASSSIGGGSDAVGSDAPSPSLSAAAATLAQRRMHRPPLFRRRSRSLDDADAEEADIMMESLLDERQREGRERDGTARPAVRIDTLSPARDHLQPSRPLSAHSTTASLADSQATSLPSSVTSSSLSTLGGGSALPGAPESSRGPPTAGSPPRAEDRTDSSCPAPRSSSRQTASEDRLASWVRSTSQDGLVGAQPIAPPVDSPDSNPSRAIRLPVLPALPPRQPYTPVLPSPLSTCSYTSADDDEVDIRGSGFPFPPTPHGTSLTPETDDTSRPQSLRSASPPKSAPQTAVPSPGGSPGRLPSFPPRPAFQSFASGSTVSNSTASTVAGTPLPQAAPAIAKPAEPPHSSSDPTRSAAAAPSTGDTVSSSSSPPGPSTSGHGAPTTVAAAAASRARSHTRGTSASSHSFLPSSYASLPRSTGSGPPLTPPDSLSAGPWQANASASELAWHEVLSAKFGAGVGALSGSAGALGGGASTAGRSDSSAGSAHFALPAPAAVAALGRADGSVRPRLTETGSWGASTGTGTGGYGTGAAGGEGGAGGGNGGSPGKKSGWQGNELMGNAAAGTYAARTKDALAGLIAQHIAGVPLDDGEETVHIVEYGALNSRSCALVPRVVEHFAEREAGRNAGAHAVDPDELLSFQVTHADRPTADFRCLSAFLDADPDSYLRKSRADLNLDGRVFSTFAARPSGVKVLPKKSVTVGFSAMSLHWPSTDRKYRVAPATLAHGELMAFLSARASEFKPGGLLTLAYIARSEEAALAANSPGTYSPSGSGSPAMTASPVVESAPGTSPITGRGEGPVAAPSSGTAATPVQPFKKDVWAHLTSVLGKAIQRLVSTGLLKPQVARQLLALPLHPRTPRQTQACLRASAHSWDVLDSSIVTMSHPAWTGVEHGTVSIESWADQTIQVVKIFWEDEMRSVLRDSLGSRGACEWVLDCLWTVAKEKLEEQPPQPLDLEVQLVALRRRERPASVPSSPTEGAQHKLPVSTAPVDGAREENDVEGPTSSRDGPLVVPLAGAAPPA